MGFREGSNRETALTWSTIDHIKARHLTIDHIIARASVAMECLVARLERG